MAHSEQVRREGAGGEGAQEGQGWSGREEERKADRQADRQTSRQTRRALAREKAREGAWGRRGGGEFDKGGCVSLFLCLIVSLSMSTVCLCVCVWLWFSLTHSNPPSVPASVPPSSLSLALARSLSGRWGRRSSGARSTARSSQRSISWYGLAVLPSLLLPTIVSYCYRLHEAQSANVGFSGASARTSRNTTRSRR
eukprot:938395-Rhodomonas_salina.1